MLLDLSLGVLAIEFTLNPLRFDRVLHYLVDILSLFIFGISRLCDHELTLNHYEDVAGLAALADEFAVFGHCQVLGVGGQPVQRGSAWP